MNTARYIKFRYKGERLWLITTRLNDEHAIGCVWNRPMNKSLLFGQFIGGPFKDILDTWYLFAYGRF